MLQSSTVTKKRKNHGHTIVLAKLIWIAVLREWIICGKFQLMWGGGGWSGGVEGLAIKLSVTR